MPITQVVSSEDYEFLELVRAKVLEDREIDPSELNKALNIIITGSREARTITAAAASKRASKSSGTKQSLQDLMNLGNTVI